MKLRTALATLLAGTLALALVAPAAAARDFDAAISQPAIAPAGPGDSGKPDNPGGHRPEMPDIPENASPRAHAAVEATYERFAVISARIDAIRAIEPGPDRNAALNELFSELSGMIHTVSDAVHEVDVEAAEHDAQPENADATVTVDDEPTMDVETADSETDDGESEEDRNRSRDSESKRDGGDDGDSDSSADDDSSRDGERNRGRTRDANDEPDLTDDRDSTSDTDHKD